MRIQQQSSAVPIRQSAPEPFNRRSTPGAK
jgi:hypothetical protein